MSNQHSVIEHRANYFFLKLEEDYIAIFPEEDKHRHCKAAILSILEHWMNSKRTEASGDCDGYVYLSYPQFTKQMFELFGRSTVIRCIKELVIEGLVLSHPYIDTFNQKTFAYMLNVEAINALLRALPKRKGSVKINGGSVKINDPSSKVNGGSFKNELPSFKSERNIDYIDSNTDSSQTNKEGEDVATSLQEDRNAPANVYDFEQKKTESAKLKAVSLQIATDYKKDTETIVIPPRLTLQQKEQTPIESPPPGDGAARNRARKEHDEPRASENSKKRTRSRKPVEKEPPLTLDSQQQAFWELWCNVWFNAEIKPTLNETAFKHVAQLAPYITDADTLNSLIEYTRKDLADSIGMKRKMVQLGNMVHCYAGWKQEQKPVNDEPNTNGLPPRKDFTGMGRLLKAN